MRACRINIESDFLQLINQIRDLAPWDETDSPEFLRIIAEEQASYMRHLLGEVSPAIDLEKAVRFDGVQVSYIPNFPALGCCQYMDNGEWFIFIKKEASPGCQRFTLAHELKHIIDFFATARFYPESDTNSAVDEHYIDKGLERICNHFAACLLMPRDLIRQEWEQGTREFWKLADKFKVSRSAMIVRLRHLGLWELHQSGSSI